MGWPGWGGVGGAVGTGSGSGSGTAASMVSPPQQLLLLAAAPLAAAHRIVFEPPQLVSAPVQCYDAKQKQLCGYVQNATCKCPGVPMAAGGTDSFYGLDANATTMFGIYGQQGMAGNKLTYTSDG